MNKYYFLFNKRESTDLKYLNDSKVFIEYFNNMDDIYKKNIEEYNLNKKRKTLIIFDDIVADMHIIRGRKLKMFLFFNTQSYLKVAKNARLNTTHFLL